LEKSSWGSPINSLINKTNGLKFISNAFAKKGIFTTRKTLYFFVIGLLIREFLAPWTGHPYDFEVFVRVGYYVAHGANPYTLLTPIKGISFSPYGNLTSVGYPPLWPLICGGIYLLFRSLSFLTSSPFLYYSLLKQPAIIADLLCAYLFILLIPDQKLGKKASLFWLFNPLTILFSSVWGMFDSLAVLLCLISLLLLVRNKAALSGISLGLSGALKMIPLIFIPAFSLFSKKKVRLFIVSIVVALAAALLPFIVFRWNPTSFFSAMSSQAVNARNAPAVGGLTAFSVLNLINMKFPNTFSPQFLVALSYLWIAAFMIFYIWLLLPFFRKKMSSSPDRSKDFARQQTASLSLQNVLRYSIIAALLFLITRVWISEQYVLYFIAFALIDVALFSPKKKKIFTIMWVLALLFLIANNTLLIRFLTPVWTHAFYIDLQINNSPLYGSIRYVVTAVIATLFYIAAIKMLILYCREGKEKPIETTPAPMNEMDA
jgi:Gpi18-like mannosyltransferase